MLNQLSFYVKNLIENVKEPTVKEWQDEAKS
jgi:hypothetical protein